MARLKSCPFKAAAAFTHGQESEFLLADRHTTEVVPFQSSGSFHARVRVRVLAGWSARL